MGEGSAEESSEEEKKRKKGNRNKLQTKECNTVREAAKSELPYLFAGKKSY